MDLSRRELLRALASTGLASGLVALPGLGRVAFGASRGTRPILLVVHLRGGCDGLNLISPADDADFVAARASDLRVADSGGDAGLSLGSTDGRIDFRLHPKAAPLAELYQQKQLSFIHAAGLTTKQRSHFVAIDMIERGAVDPSAIGRINTGWIARHLEALNIGGGVHAVSVGAALSGEMLGAHDALALGEFGNTGVLPGGGPEISDAIEALYAVPGRAEDVRLMGRTTMTALREIDRHLLRDAKGKIVNPDGPGAHAYDEGAELGRALRGIAQLIRMEIGLEVATVDLGGWDTHENQKGRFADRVNRLASGLAAFWNDLAPYHDQLVVVVQTEFGRRLRSNRSGGTDHGRGGVMAVLGGRVNGGRIAGRWPGLTADRLEEGVDLAVVNDYRQVITEVLALRGGASVFPGFTPAGSLGLLRA